MGIGNTIKTFFSLGNILIAGFLLLILNAAILLIGSIYNEFRILSLGTYVDCEITTCERFHQALVDSEIRGEYLYFDCTDIRVLEEEDYCKDNPEKSVILFKSEKLKQAHVVREKSMLSVISKLYFNFGALIINGTFVFFLIAIFAFLQPYYKKEYVITKSIFKNYESKELADKIKVLSDYVILGVCSLLSMILPLVIMLVLFNYENSILYVNGILLLLILAAIFCGPLFLLFLYNSFLLHKQKWIILVRNIFVLLTSLRLLYILIVLAIKIFKNDVNIESISELFMLILELFLNL